MGCDSLDLEIAGITLKQCNEEFRDIYDAIKDRDPNMSLSVLKKVKSSTAWVFHRDEREKSTQRLSRARATLPLAISTLYGYISDSMNLV